MLHYNACIPPSHFPHIPFFYYMRDCPLCNTKSGTLIIGTAQFNRCQHTTSKVSLNKKNKSINMAMFTHTQQWYCTCVQFTRVSLNWYCKLKELCPSTCLHQETPQHYQPAVKLAPSHLAWGFSINSLKLTVWQTVWHPPVGLLVYLHVVVKEPTNCSQHVAINTSAATC